MAAGFALRKDRPLVDTIKFIAVSIGGYLIAWNAIYYCVISFAPEMVRNALMMQGGFFEILSYNIIEHRGNAVHLLGPTWFLIILALATISSSVLNKVWRGNTYVALIVGLVISIVSWATVPMEQPKTPEWLVRMTIYATGHILLGHAIFNSKISEWIKKPGVILPSLGLALWLGSVLPKTSFAHIWYYGETNGILSLLQTLCYLPIVMVVARYLSSMEVFKFIGERSKHIMTHHLLGFVLVEIFLVAFGQKSIWHLKVYGWHNIEVMWPIHIAAGIIISVLIGTISDTVWKKVIEIKENSFEKTLEWQRS